jgi:hypothetical protein
MTLEMWLHQQVLYFTACLLLALAYGVAVKR